MYDERDKQRIFNIVVILVAKLGGKVEITEAEINKAPTGTVSTNPNGIIIEVENGR